MNAQMLERLMIDRSLGALQPDVVGLLEAWFEQDEAAARLAGEFANTVDLARQAWPVSPPGHLPDYSAARMQRERRIVRIARRARGMTALAACLLLGMGVGALLFPDHANTSEPTLVARLPGVQPEVHAADNAFWSVRQLYRHAETSRIGSSERLVWDSPIMRPKIQGAI